MSRDRLFVREIRVVGSTVFTAEDLSKVVAPYEGRELAVEDFEEARLALTRLYVDRGYVNSGAILPDQTVSDGVVTIQIIEGELSRIEVTDNRWFRESHLRRRVEPGARTPLNVNELRHQLQLLQQDPRIKRIDSELKPGLRLGESVLALRVEEVRPYRLLLDVNNYHNPAVGEIGGSITLQHQNLTGHGDVLSLGYGRTEGVNPQLDFRYSIPLTARDTTFGFQYRKNDFVIVTETFQDLDITSESEIFGFTLRHPVYRTIRQEFGLELTGERLSNTTFVLGERFSLFPGAEDGEMIVTALRISADWLYRTRKFVLAARSRFSLGVDALGATIHNSSQGPDGRYFAWLGQFQWVQRLPFWDSQLIFRADIQRADDALLALEQAAVGGRYSVRGYREVTALRDSTVIASLESRVPLISQRRWADYIEIAPFVDFADATNVKSANGDDDIRLASIGMGLRWAVTTPGPGPFRLRPQFEVYWGYRLLERDRQGSELQDHGVHLQLTVAAF
ncbi:MAG TPA: ShlB/FhaC/HecB family hemolysin secretion/activation protein [Methylomirabilota bacterium]|nr:ShlB/FhaC/HecB family hemolysin secretion/activation protein [Methylomirabilota bacterium]